MVVLVLVLVMLLASPFDRARGGDAITATTPLSLCRRTTLLPIGLLRLLLRRQLRRAAGAVARSGRGRQEHMRWVQIAGGKCGCPL
jgi:hypothetical protein